MTRTTLERGKYLWRSLGFVWVAARGWTIAWVLLLAVQGLLPIAAVCLTKKIVDGIAAAASRGVAWQNVLPILVAGALMAAVLLATELMEKAITWIRGNQAELLKNHISSLIHAKSIEADLAFYESAEFYDSLHRARDDAGHRPMMLLETAGSAFQNGITLVAMAAVLLPLSLWLPPALFLSSLPAFYVVLRFTGRRHKWWLSTTPDERRSWYYDWLITTGETASELRLFGLGGHFAKTYQSLRRHLWREQLKLDRHQNFAELGAGVIGLAVTGVAMVWMVWRVLLGALTLGDLALCYQAFNKGQGLMRTLLQDFGRIYGNSLFLGNLFEFLDLKPKVIDPINPVAIFPIRKGLSFENVNFQYPGSKRNALNDFNLFLPAGRITALVGANGAGKSTLIKLICRFYDPDSGRISLDGIDLRDFRLEELRRSVTVLFQEPVHYNNTVADNISYGDIGVNPTRSDIRNAAAAAGADLTIESLPNKYNTVLGRMFESGDDLSVGEWQRITLARAFLRKAPILLLDEPTSAMDSWAEADWLERLRVHTAGQTVLIITHRFTTAMRADVIHVMAGGRIIESGSHADLATMGGLYAESWSKQGNCILMGPLTDADIRRPTLTKNTQPNQCKPA